VFIIRNWYIEIIYRFVLLMIKRKTFKGFCFDIDRKCRSFRELTLNRNTSTHLLNYPLAYGNINSFLQVLNVLQRIDANFVEINEVSFDLVISNPVPLVYNLKLELYEFAYLNTILFFSLHL